MAKLIKKVEGARGRSMELYDTKCVIKTKISVGSVLTHNATDGEKTIFLKDVVGVQFKKSGALIGYIQFETPSMQMNNSSSNMFSENTFTFEDGRNGVTNESMEMLYKYIIDHIEALKYGTESPIIENTFAEYENKAKAKKQDMLKMVKENAEQETLQHDTLQEFEESLVDIVCPECDEVLSFSPDAKAVECPYCGYIIEIGD